jgi:hypothetical protein
MAMKKNPVSGKTVKTTTYSPLNPFKKDVKMVNERTTRKPATKNQTVPAKTTTKAPAKTKMTPQDAAMLKILKKKYGADVYKG